MFHWLCAKKRTWLALLSCPLFAFQITSASASSDIPTVRCGNRGQKRIAITIDDCYDIDHVRAAIELCEKYGIPITFFPIGNALKYAALRVPMRSYHQHPDVSIPAQLPLPQVFLPELPQEYLEAVN